MLNISQRSQRPFTTPADTLIRKKEANQETISNKTEIDTPVSDLHGLTGDEINMVNGI